MKLRFPALACALLLLLGGCGVVDSIFRGDDDTASGAAPATGLPADGERVYFVMEERGQRRSSGYQVRSEGRYRGTPCIITERRRTDTIRREGERTVFEVQKSSKVITSLSGAGLYAEETTTAGQEQRREVLEIRDGTAYFTSIGPGGRDKAKMKVPRGIPFGIEPAWLVQQPLRPGARFQRQVFDRSQRRLTSERVTILHSQMEPVLGMERGVWVAETQREGYAPQRMVFTSDGQFVRIEDEGMVVRVATRAEVEQEAEPVTIVNSIDLGFKLPAWDNFTTLVFEATPAEAWREHVPSSEYVDLREEGGRLLLTLKKNPPYSVRVRRAQLPLDVPAAMQPFLGKGPTVMPHRLEIMRQAKRIVGQQNDVLGCVAQLAGWVHHRIRFQQTSALNPSPLETMDTASGDCSEHADLFASLARSLGIPTRHCQGLLVQSGEGVYHAWAEAWIGGTWVPVDTTVSRVGLPAGYLLTSQGTGDGEPRDEFGWRMRQGDLRLQLVEARKMFPNASGGEPFEAVLTPGNKRSYLVARDNWLAHLYWGFTIERPENWKGSIGLNQVAVRSPDREARLVCEGLPQQYQATSVALDRVVVSLERGLDRFRLNDARLLPFVPAGRRQPVDALMVDFTCEQDGKRLRCRQYIIPRRDRSYRIASWAPEASFDTWIPTFEMILRSVQL